MVYRVNGLQGGGSSYEFCLLIFRWILLENEIVKAIYIRPISPMLKEYLIKQGV